MRLKKIIAAMTAAAALVSAAALPAVSYAADETVTLYSEDFETVELINHPMDSDAAVDKVKDGYVSMVDGIKAKSVSFKDGAMYVEDQYNPENIGNSTQGKVWSSSGIKYDISTLIDGKRDGTLTLTAKLSTSASTATGKIGFLDNDTANLNNFSGESVATVALTAGNKSDIITYTRDLTSGIPKYIGFTVGDPSIFVSDIKLTYTPGTTPPSEISSYLASFGQNSRVEIATLSNGEKALKFTNTRNGDNVSASVGSAVIIALPNVLNGDTLSFSVDVEATEGLGSTSAFVLSAKDLDDATYGVKAYIKRYNSAKDYVDYSNGGYYNLFISSKKYTLKPDDKENKATKNTINVSLDDNNKNAYLVITSQHKEYYVDNIKVEKVLDTTKDVRTTNEGAFTGEGKSVATAFKGTATIDGALKIFTVNADVGTQRLIFDEPKSFETGDVFGVVVDGLYDETAVGVATFDTTSESVPGDE